MSLASDWILDAQFWVVVGLLLVLADIFLGFALFVLPIGVAALIIAGMIAAQENEVLGSMVLYRDWQDVVYWFAALSVISVLLLRLVFQKRKEGMSDINDY
jgi:membrane protein implicated in regulation of membrane protease activity